MLSLMGFRKDLVLLTLILTMLLSAAWPAGAANIYIDYTCVLKDALRAANRDEEKDDCEAGSGDDTIILTRDDKPRSGTLPSVEENLIIDGRNYTINADEDDPAFKVKDANLTIRNIKIEFDDTRKGPAFEVTNGKLTLINVVVENCERGIKRRNGHVSIRGNSDICGLDADEILEGTGTSDISLPPPTIPQTCSELPAGSATISATFGQSSGVQCRHLDGSGIGVQSIIDAGFISAIDVWGYVDQGVEVCFPQLGSITFLDAATSPRSVSTIDSYSRGNSTCTHLTRAGAVILMPGTPTGVGQPAVAQPAASQPVAAAQPVTNLVAGPVQPGCPLVATGHLRQFDVRSPEAEIIGWITRGSTMTVVSRTLGWYQVQFGGQTGWVGGKYTAGTGQC